jgi:hypothetical protein
LNNRGNKEESNNRSRKKRAVEQPRGNNEKLNNRSRIKSRA